MARRNTQQVKETVMRHVDKLQKRKNTTPCDRKLR